MCIRDRVKHTLSSLVSKKGFEPFHPANGDRVYFIAAARGSGKSTWCNTYIKNYVESTDGRVFFISRFESDPSIQLPERGMRISIPDLMTLNLSDLHDSLLVFDDINDSHFSTKERAFLQNYIIDCIENSRHYNTSCLISSHQVSNYSRTRHILAEMSGLVVFPQHSTAFQVERGLRYYLGLSKQQTAEIMENPDRWVLVQSRKPKYVMSQHRLYEYK